MRILVTGGSGLVGKALREESLNTTHEWFFSNSQICDLRDYRETATYFASKKPDYVIHLAANVGGLFKNLDNNLIMYEENMLINFNVLRACHENGIKNCISLLSTCIFPDKTSYPINETMLHNGPPHLSNEGYSYAKRLLDVHCKLYNSKYNYNYKCIIPTNLYGKHDNFSIKNGHVIPALIHKCYLESSSKKVNKWVNVWGTGQPLRQFLYVNDLAKIIINSIDNITWQKEHNSLIVAPTEEISILEVSTIIGKQFRLNNIRLHPEKSDGQYKKTADNSLFKKYFPNFQFVSFENGITNTCRHFFENYSDVRK